MGLEFVCSIILLFLCYYACVLHVGRGRKWHENEGTVLKVGGLVALFTGHVRGVIKWPENEATVLKVGGLVALFTGHVGGGRK